MRIVIDRRKMRSVRSSIYCSRTKKHRILKGIYSRTIDTSEAVKRVLANFRAGIVKIS